MSVGKRLKEERKRLRLTQDELGVACGVSKWAQFNFEKDVNMPGGAYLLAALGRGVDIMYVLTGQRAEVAPSDAALLAAFHQASHGAQVAALAALGLAPPATTSAGPTINIKRSEIGQVNTVSGDLHSTVTVGGKKKR